MKIAKKIKLNGPVISGISARIYEWIGLDAISPNRVLNELEKAGGEDIELYINSGGGSVFAGSEIFTALKEYPGKITSKITGVAASAATFFVLASDEVYISPLGQMMIHNAATSTDGDRFAHTSNLEMLEGVDKAIAKVYQAKTKMSDADLLDFMRKTTWMNADKSVQMGFANSVMFEEEVDATNSANAGFELPQEVIDKLKDVLLKNVMANMTADGVSIGIEPINSLQNLPQQQTNERNDKPMKLEELKAQHPDLYNEVLNAGKTEGVTAERSRIVALNALANSPGAAEIVAKAIENGTSAGEAAIEIVQASAQRVKDVAAGREEDAKASGAAEVPAEEAPLNENQGNTVDHDAEAAAIVAEINKLKGGK
ncbi:head maturation protease, ClpP-related [Paenibacillus camelliae]|uniref:head maturation protease, ClpP-related n=1 Tax=Paenibacillus camelliae TaxID=512410 RepID=UPI002040930F|nr:head maturation protease, ClpP-related [Paenibacillus camelliae]MCM3632942.1 Clp protease ClpP [Paenibacillus camelliae]